MVTERQQQVEMSSAARAVGTATVRRVKRSLLPTRYQIIM